MIILQENSQNFIQTVICSVIKAYKTQYRNSCRKLECLNICNYSLMIKEKMKDRTHQHPAESSRCGLSHRVTERAGGNLEANSQISSGLQDVLYGLGWDG